MRSEDHMSTLTSAEADIGCGWAMTVAAKRSSASA
jgi:hypothetical protein